MAEISPASKTKVKSAPPAMGLELPKFDFPKFEVPNVEVPAALREFAEKSVAQAKDNYEKMKSVAEEATDVLEGTYLTASKGASEYGLKAIDAARVNVNAAFDFMAELMTAKSASDVVELSTTHLREQFETATAQVKNLTAIAQKVAVEATEPIKGGFTSAFKKSS